MAARPRAPRGKPVPPDPDDPDDPASEAGEGEDVAQEQGGSLPRFVTSLAPIEHQVGAHVIGALQHPGTVAVLSVVALGSDGGQRIVSVGLDEELLAQVEGLLGEASPERSERVPCVGFHCVLRDREGSQSRVRSGERPESQRDTEAAPDRE